MTLEYPTTPATDDPAQQFKPGWLQEQVAKSVAALDALPDDLRRSLRGGTR